MVTVPASATRAAPCLGEHTHAILRELLKISPAEIRALEATGTIADTPPAANAA